MSDEEVKMSIEAKKNIQLASANIFFPVEKTSHQWQANPIPDLATVVKGGGFWLELNFFNTFWIGFELFKTTRFLSKGQWTYGPTLCLSIDIWV